MPIFYLLLSFNSFSEIEYHSDTKQISQKYYDGPFLIYDCEKSHWACVDKDGKVDCDKARDFAKINFRKNLACVVFKEFKSRKDCELFQQKKVNNPGGKEYCKHSKVKEGTTR